MNTSKIVRIISVLMLSSLYGTKVYAADSAEHLKVAKLETITTIGTRTKRTLSELDASVSVKTSDQMEQELARDLEDLVRFEPGVSVGGTGSRFGLEGISIRGIGGNRVLTTLDGIRVPEEFSFGPFLSSRRDYVDIDALQRADIARGPISSLYGSDALGGVVAFTSKRPVDYLEEGSHFHAGLKTGYSSDDSSTVVTLITAGQLIKGSDGLSGLLTYTRRDAEEAENQGSAGGTSNNRELPDPQDISSDSLTVRVVYQPSDFTTFSLSGNLYRNDTDTQVLSDYDTLSRGVLTTSRDAEDERERSGVTLSYQYDGSLALSDRLDAKVYYQASKSQQLTTDGRVSRGVAQIRTRFSEFEQDIFGAQLNINKEFKLDSVSHLISYGVDYYKTENVSQRTGASANAITGEPIPEFFPFPTRDFPLTDVEQTAFYLQNEISLLDNKLRITPGIRYDNFSADATADSVFITGNPGTPLPEDYEDSELTAKLGLVYQVTDQSSVYARYSEGFRAPPYDDVNVGFSNFIAGYKTISNPDLKSETSKGYELGARFQNDMGYFSIAAFRNDYQDFIESLALANQFLVSGGIDPNDGLLTFQSTNLDAVEIEGLEFSGAVNLSAFNERFQGVSLKASLAYADGEDSNTQQPIDSVEPLSGVFGLAYQSPGKNWGGNLYMSFVDGKDSSDISADSLRNPVRGYALLDLMAHYKITDKVRLDAGIFNLTDKAYVRWADTASIADDAINRFTQPGINTRITLRLEL